MPAIQPEECTRLLIEAIEAGDVDAAVALYEPQATFVVPPGRSVSGHGAIREILQGFFASKDTGGVSEVSMTISADGTLAVLRTRGVTQAPGPDGSPIPMAFHSVEVVRKQPDGTWRFVIDDPSGAGVATIALG